MTAESDRIPAAAYCAIRKSQATYDGKPVRVRALWHYDGQQKISYIHSEPECVGRTGLGAGGLCPAMESVLRELGGPFDADVVISGSFYSQKPGKDIADDGGDGSYFISMCIERFEKRPGATGTDQLR
jgi:hypothetical protein